MLTSLEPDPTRADRPATGAPRKQRHLLPLCVLLLASAAIMLPILLFGLPSGAHDTLTHTRWQLAFGAQFWDGDLYPRWLPTLNDGLGSPAFFIYPPVPHFAAALLAPLSDSAAWAHHRVGIAAAIALFAGGAGAYLWLHEVTRERFAALAGALVFLLAPYHLYIDTYYRAAYAELWAFAWAPFSLLAIHLFARMPARALVLYAFATAALFASHAPSCIALPPLYAAYAVLLSVKARRWDILLWTGAGSVAALMIAGAYLATAFTHQGYMNAAALYSGFFDFGRWFLLSAQRWHSQRIELSILGVTGLQCGLLFLLAALVLRYRAVTAVQRGLVWLAVLASITILFMMSAPSEPVWQLVPLAQKIQFPWRLLTAQTLLLALVCALYAVRVHSSGARPRGLERKVSVALLVALAVANAGLIRFVHPSFDRNTTPVSRDVPEYQLGDLPTAGALFEEGKNIQLIDGQGVVAMTAVGPRQLRVQIDAATPVRFIVRQSYYPGWECTGSTLATPCSVRTFDAAPVVEVLAGPGRGQLDVVLAPTPQERIGAIVSWAGLLLLAVLAGVAAARGRRRAA